MHLLSWALGVKGLRCRDSNVLAPNLEDIVPNPQNDKKSSARRKQTADWSTHRPRSCFSLTGSRKAEKKVMRLFYILMSPNLSEQLCRSCINSARAPGERKSFRTSVLKRKKIKLIPTCLFIGQNDTNSVTVLPADRPSAACTFPIKQLKLPHMLLSPAHIHHVQRPAFTHQKTFSCPIWASWLMNTVCAWGSDHVTSCLTAAHVHRAHRIKTTCCFYRWRLKMNVWSSLHGSYPGQILRYTSDWTMTFDPVTQMFHQSRSGWVFNKEQMFPWRPCGDALSGTFLIIVLNLFWMCKQCTKIIEGKWILHKVTSTWSSA